jgi:hypothetical protein
MSLSTAIGQRVTLRLIDPDEGRSVDLTGVLAAGRGLGHFLVTDAGGQQHAVHIDQIAG